MSPKMIIEPPLLNSSSPWATSLTDLKSLYACPFTGAITTRTSLINGFNDRPDRHQHCFFDAGTAVPDESASNVGHPVDSATRPRGNSSLNTYGYSPVQLHEYISYIKQLTTTNNNNTETPSKMIIISVTGTPGEISTSYKMIHDLSRAYASLRLAMEINLSCPNIAGKPPPAYDPSSLTEYLQTVHGAKQQSTSSTGQGPPVAVGIKLPPYTYQGQFDMVVDCLRTTTVVTGDETKSVSVIDFVTSTNTLGSSLVLDEQQQPALKSEAGTGVGGMAGAAIHGLSLGNVATLHRLLARHEETSGIFLIGVGGVCDRAGFDRMRSVGAGAVAIATALGRDGVDVFEKITTGS